MKEATGEGSMTIITIVIIVALAAAAGVVVKLMSDKAKTSTDQVTTMTPDVCPDGYTYSATDKKCTKNAG